MQTLDNQHLSLKFITNRSYVIWGIIGLIMGIWFAIIVIIGNNTDAKTAPYSGIALVLGLFFCGIKLLINGLSQRLFVNDDKIEVKSITGKIKTILWKDIISVTLSKKPPALIIKSQYETIQISLKLKNWELVLETMEDKLSDDKFLDFN